MVQVVVNLSSKANKAVGIVKASYNLSNKSKAIDFIIEKFAGELIEPPLREDYIKRIKKAEKGKFVEIKDVDAYFKKMLKWLKLNYFLEVTENADKSFKKLAKKDKKQHEAALKKIKQILKNPYSFKPLKKPMQGQRRVHINHFVLTYSIDEKNKTIKILDYSHHDKVYKM